MEEGAEDRARQFYGNLLGLTEVTKPAPLAVRGGCWFVGRGVHLHLGVERDMRASPKAHIALVVDDVNEARERFGSAGVEVVDDDSGVGLERFYVHDGEEGSAVRRIVG